MCKSKRFLSLKEVAERYDITYNTALTMAKEGRIPAFQLGGRGKWLVNVDALERLEGSWRDSPCLEEARA